MPACPRQLVPPHVGRPRAVDHDAVVGGLEVHVVQDADGQHGPPQAHVPRCSRVPVRTSSRHRRGAGAAGPDHAGEVTRTGERTTRPPAPRWATGTHPVGPGGGAGDWRAWRPPSRWRSTAASSPCTACPSRPAPRCSPCTASPRTVCPGSGSPPRPGPRHRLGAGPARPRRVACGRWPVRARCARRRPRRACSTTSGSTARWWWGTRWGRSSPRCWPPGTRTGSSGRCSSTAGSPSHRRRTSRAMTSTPCCRPCSALRCNGSR